VRFEAREEAMEALCAPRDIASLVLEMICNCALHCRGEEINLSLETKKRRGRRGQRGKDARQDSVITLTARCEGSLDLDSLHAAGQREGSGTAAMRRVARLHRGALLWLERDGISIAALRLSGRQGGRIADWYDAPDYVEMLSDPCSQVYVGLAPAVGGVHTYL